MSLFEIHLRKSLKIPKYSQLHKLHQIKRINSKYNPDISAIPFVIVLPKYRKLINKMLFKTC